jgi:hypothetical protein
MTTISNATTTDLRNKAAEWREMTQNNEHSEVLCDIAFFFEMDSELVNYFFELGFKDGLTMKEYNERYDKGEAMLATIKANHGETIYNLIKKAI